jgi:hypothetical protein
LKVRALLAGTFQKKNKMLCDILLALSGFPGNVIEQEAISNEFRVSASANSFLSPNHSAVINRLCIIASHHAQLAQLVRLHSVPLHIFTPAAPAPAPTGEDISAPSYIAKVGGYSDLQSQQHPSRAHQQQRLQSVYASAFFAGVDEMLGDYRAVLLRLEQSALKVHIFIVVFDYFTQSIINPKTNRPISTQERELTMPNILHDLADFEVQFPAVLRLISR